MRHIVTLLLFISPLFLKGQIQGEDAMVFEEEIREIMLNPKTVIYDRVEVKIKNSSGLFHQRSIEYLTYWFVNDTVVKLRFQNESWYFSKCREHFYQIDSTLSGYPGIHLDSLKTLESITLDFDTTVNKNVLEWTETQRVSKRKRETIMTYPYKEVRYMVNGPPVPTGKVIVPKTRRTVIYDKNGLIRKVTVVDRDGISNYREVFKMYVSYVERK